MSKTASNEPGSRPYRWGYFQGVMLIPWSLLLLLGVASNAISPQPDPWYLLTIGYLMGFLGLPLAYGLLRKKQFALALVYVMFGLSVALAAIKLPIAIKHFADGGDKGSAFFEAELVLLWLLSLVYYRKRKTQFR